MRALRFHAYGEPSEVVRLDNDAAVPQPGSKSLRIATHACALNPADWALCRSQFASVLPRGIGLDVSGIVDAVGEEVSGVKPGDRVLGPANYAHYETAGASDFAIMDHWALVPAGLDMTVAAALPMAIETAYRSLDFIEVGANQTVLIHGAGTVIGFAAVQMARRSLARSDGRQPRRQRAWQARARAVRRYNELVVTHPTYVAGSY